MSQSGRQRIETCESIATTTNNKQGNRTARCAASEVAKHCPGSICSVVAVEHDHGLTGSSQ